MATVDPKEKHNKGICSYLWTNFNSQVVETTDSINIFCSKEESNTQSWKFYIKDVKALFDHLFNKSKIK